METVQSFFQYDELHDKIGFEFGNGFVVEFYVPKCPIHESYTGCNKYDCLKIKISWKTHDVTNYFFDCKKYETPPITIEEVPMLLLMIEKIEGSNSKWMELIKLRMKGSI